MRTHEQRSMLGRQALWALLVSLSATSGCAFDEGLIIEDMKGTVAIPVEAATRTFTYLDDDGTSRTETYTDPRLIGPVYLGLYPSVDPAGYNAAYPHPEIGPQYQPNTAGDTYPYGGTTIGDLRYACVEYLACRVVSGRFYDWDDLHTWFTQVLDAPILNQAGEPFADGDLIQQICFDIFEVTADYEIAVVSGDTNGDGATDDKDLDFQLSADGEFFEAEFTIWQQQFYWDVAQEAETGCTPGEDCTGFSLWGFMDSPDQTTNKFTTCDSTIGFQDIDYANDFDGGQAQIDVLNQPAKYIGEGDWVAGEGFVWSDVFEQPRLVLDFEVTQ